MGGWWGRKGRMRGRDQNPSELFRDVDILLLQSIKHTNTEIQKERKTERQKDKKIVGQKDE